MRSKHDIDTFRVAGVCVGAVTKREGGINIKEGADKQAVIFLLPKYRLGHPDFFNIFIHTIIYLQDQSISDILICICFNFNLFFRFWKNNYCKQVMCC